VFGDQAMTLAAIDRLVHHATILEMNVESYRRRVAFDRKRGRGRPSAHATIKKRKRPKLIDAPRQSKRLPKRRPASTIASLGGLVSSWLTRRSHPDCRAIEFTPMIVSPSPRTSIPASSPSKGE
jgi:IstB-like ATP binding protein